MIGDTRHLKGSIRPKLSGEKLRQLRQGWEGQVGREGVPPALLKTNGETFHIQYQTWDVGSLKKTLEIEVTRADVGGPSTQVRYNS